MATGVTHPLDVAKVRLQMQLVGRRGPLHGMVYLYKSWGFIPGLCPSTDKISSIWRSTFGLYEPCKHVCDVMLASTNILVKIASGAFSGAIATALTNPVEVLKVRVQMNSNSRGGPINEVRKIVREEGLRALWKGVGPAMARAGALTASQLATYDESKQALLRWTNLEEGFHLHLISSCIAGTMGTVVTAPVDMIKTRLMLQRESHGPKSYRNGFHCAYQVKHTEGFGALYKGGFATFARLGPQTVITFLVCEKLRELSGMKAI
ncbi:unnamed protein product [Spirodela intermedia]|uniref:Uncharacterized protein n=1 Tax=Spirodela intermedia TaxID=51605 RepID=A0A7I8JI05_SPIIN|nr:unnamed protein product [Spirodela intermedia]CAA6669062.1 unnamed protein product [Spirodela intermedia]